MSSQQSFSASRANTVGVLGNGQLGRMFVQAAHAMGFKTIVFDPEAQIEGVLSPAAQLSSHFINAAFNDSTALQSLAEQCFAVTTEFENAPAQALEFLGQQTPHVRVSPNAKAVRIAQDRTLEKTHLSSCGVPIAPYYVIASEADLSAVALDFYPAILKTARMGYDGKGQVTVHSTAQLQSAWLSLSSKVCVLEKRLSLHAECSVVLARQLDENGAERMVNWPLQRNRHVDGILATTEVGMSDPLEAPLVLAARAIATTLDYVGVLCIEFFILDDGSWIVNEMAPRPHNSGHVTMDASSLSQFEAQVRVTAGLPLVQPRQHSCAVMLNLLGDLWFEGANSKSTHSQPTCEPNWAGVLALGNGSVGVHLHLYGKEQARRARKMGHINVTANNLRAAWHTATSIQQILQ